MDKRFGGREKLIFPEYDMRVSWSKALKRLSETDIERVIKAMDESTEWVFGAYKHVVGGLSDYNQQDDLLELTYKAFSINWRPNGKLSLLSMVDTLMEDKNFNTMGFDERKERINLMRVTSWISRVGVVPHEVSEYGRACVEKEANEGGSSKSVFMESVNKKFPTLNLPQDMASSFFDMVTDPEKGLELETSAYFMAR
jgi:hypothetical protein